MCSKKTILILGGGGMLGHSLSNYLLNSLGHDVFVSLRNDLKKDKILSFIDAERIFSDIKTSNIQDYRELIIKLNPDVVINCIGMLSVNEQPSVLQAIKINSLFPLQISSICHEMRIHFVHISTDAVFNGKEGNYLETSQTSPIDSYGLTKLLGEPSTSSDLVIRTSIIGHSLNQDSGLIDWLLSSPREISGYSAYLYSGLSTLELSRIIGLILDLNYQLSGIINVSSDPLSKYELLKKASGIYGLNRIIKPLAEPKINRSLDSSVIEKLINDKIISWDQMLESMHQNYLDNLRLYK